MNPKILVIGACGQIGTELTLALRKLYGRDQVIASDIKEGSGTLMSSGPFETLNAMDKLAVEACVEKHRVSDVYLLAAMLSATSEKFPQKAWELNMSTLSHILELARDKKIQKVFWPSSIAVFGDTTPKENTPQTTIKEPTTVYGITKLSGERWCEYFYKKYDVDVRSLRYPGLISWKANPGGGTTDYAVEIYYKAISDGKYTSFLQKGTLLPMLYMDDAIRATIKLMQAPKEQIRIRSSYNLGGISIAPENIEASIQKHLPDFKVVYQPDFRQAIADSWPEGMNDSKATEDWGWQHRFELDDITQEMLTNLKVKLSEKVE